LERLVLFRARAVASRSKIGTGIAISFIDRWLVTLSLAMMGAKHSQRLLVEAAMLISATRLRIARSMTLLARVALDGVHKPYAESRAHTGLMRSSSHPPRAPLP
jgi:hypothetical protein